MGAANQGERFVTPHASVSPFLGVLPPELWGRTKLFFAYGADFAALPAAATTPAQIAIQADSDFYCAAIVAEVWTAADANVAYPWPILAQINDASSGRNLFNQPRPLADISSGATAATSGGGSQPFYPPIGYLFRANSTVTVSLTNRTAATTFNVFLTLIGFKCFLGM